MSVPRDLAKRRLPGVKRAGKTHGLISDRGEIPKGVGTAVCYIVNMGFTL